MPVLEPHQYARRILIVVTGETPQVITETLYALLTQPKAFVPTQLVVVTTGVGAARVREKFMIPGVRGNPLRRLCDQFKVTGLSLTDSSIRTGLAPNGQPDADAHTEPELMRMGDVILATLFEFSGDDTAVHLSLSGGRKTMSFYAGQAMSLLARPQDRLSHVILNDRRFERSPDFFYPPARSVLLKVRNPLTGRLETASTKGADVVISYVPFLRLRDMLGKHTMADLSRRRPLSEMIAEANQVLNDPGEAVVAFDTEQGKVWCNHILIPFAPVEYAFYYALASLAEEDLGLTRRASDEECLQYLELRSHVTEDGMAMRNKGAYEDSVQEAYDALFGVREFRAATRLADLTQPDERRQLLQRRADVLNPQFSNVNRRLIETLGSVLSQRFLCVSSGRPKAAYYFPDSARIVWENRLPRRKR